MSLDQSAIQHVSRAQIDSRGTIYELADRSANGPLDRSAV